jgi:hypothetical protein
LAHDGSRHHPDDASTQAEHDIHSSGSSSLDDHDPRSRFGAAGLLILDTWPLHPRLDGQPHGVDADQRSHSRSQAAHDDADSTGQCTNAVALPLFSSTRMSRAGISASGCTSSAMKSGIGKVGTSVDFGGAALRSSARHLCTTFAFRLYSLAIAAADASGS